jgi:cytochrome bd-type quinol oxidase subunit 2
MILELIILFGMLLITYAAYQDWKDREYDMSLFIYISIISLILFGYKLYNNMFTTEDFYVMFLFFVVTGSLLLLKKVGEGDLALVFLLLVAPFNFAVALLFSSLFVIPFSQYGHKLIGMKEAFIKPPTPFVTVMFAMFLLITVQMYFDTGEMFWSVCMDLTQNSETISCTFLALEAGVDNIATNTTEVFPAGAGAFQIKDKKLGYSDSG